MNAGREQRAGLRRQWRADNKAREQRGEQPIPWKQWIRDDKIERVRQALIADGANDDGVTLSRAGAAVNAMGS